MNLCICSYIHVFEYILIYVHEHTHRGISYSSVISDGDGDGIDYVNVNSSGNTYQIKNKNVSDYNSGQKNLAILCEMSTFNVKRLKFEDSPHMDTFLRSRPFRSPTPKPGTNAFDKISEFKNSNDSNFKVDDDNTDNDDRDDGNISRDESSGMMDLENDGGHESMHDSERHVIHLLVDGMRVTYPDDFNNRPFGDENNGDGDGDNSDEDHLRNIDSMNNNRIYNDPKHHRRSLFQDLCFHENQNSNSNSQSGSKSSKVLTCPSPMNALNEKTPTTNGPVRQLYSRLFITYMYVNSKMCLYACFHGFNFLPQSKCPTFKVVLHHIWDPPR